MSNNKVTVKRRNNNKNKKNNNSRGAGNVTAQLLKALLKPKQQNKKRSKPRNSNKGKDTGGYANIDRISAPTAFGQRMQMVKPKFSGGRTIIKHSEYIQDINGTTGAFAIQASIPCNPGLVGSFPWLSQIAGAYQKYIIKNLEFRFETSSSANQTGDLMLSPVFNEQDGAPDTKADCLQNECTTKCVPWMSLGCRIPTKYLKVYNEYYIRTTTINDVKTYDPFILYVGCQANTVTTSIGELYVDYEIELINPIGNQLAIGGELIGGAALAAAHVFNNGTVYGPLTIGGVFSGNNQISFSPLVIGQEYQCVITIDGASLLTLSEGSAIGLTLSSAAAVSTVNAAATQMSAVYTWIATAVTGYITVTTTGTTFTSSVLVFSPIFTQAYY
jgi:hypothetical protein